MKTPSLETKDDQKREERVAGFLEGLWGVTCHKLPTNYKTCQNIVITKNIKSSYFDHASYSTKLKSFSKSEIIVFLI